MLVTQSRPTLCNPTDCCPARLLCPWNYLGKNTGVGSHFLSPGDLPNRFIEPRSPALQTDSLPPEPPGKPKHVVNYKGKQQNDVCLLSHSVICWLFCEPMDHNPPGSSVHGIFQAWIPEQVAISYCRGSSWPRYWHTPLTSPDLAGWFFTTEPLGNENNIQIRDCTWIKICGIWLCTNFTRGFSKTLWYHCPISLLLTSRHSVVSDPLWHHGLQHARLPCPSLFPRVYSNLRPVSQWCHDAIQPSHSVVSFSSCLKSFPTSGSFPMCYFFTSDGQSIRVSASASALPMNIQD